MCPSKNEVRGEMWVELEAWCLCRFPQHSPKSTCAKCEKYILILYCSNCEIYLFKFFQHIQVLLLICLCSFPRHPPNQCTQSQIKISIQTLKFATLKISPPKYDLPWLKFQECVGVAYRHPDPVPDPRDTWVRKKENLYQSFSFIYLDATKELAVK